jgi:hypothetical protein
MGYTAAMGWRVTCPAAWGIALGALALFGCNSILGVDQDYEVGAASTTTGGVTGSGGTTSTSSGGTGGSGGGSGGSGGQPAPQHALELDGDNDFIITDRPLAAELTIEAWIKTTVPGAGDLCWLAVPLIYADQEGNVADFSTCVLQGGLFGLSMGADGANDTVLPSTEAINTGEWVHVAGSKGSDGWMRVYVDGAPSGELETALTDAIVGPEQILFGGNQIDGRYFRGRIREVRLWAAVRTAAEISQAYDRRLQGDEPGLIGYWPLDEGSGTTGHDLTAAGNHATLGDGNPNNVPTWVIDGPPLR